MGAKTIAFANGGLTWWRATWNEEKQQLDVVEVDGRSYSFDRGQAHLLMIYLQNKLGADGAK